MSRLIPLCLCLLMVSGIQAAGNYHLKPEMIAPGTYVLSGRNEHFNFRNGGNIVNTGFIVTKQGVVVIDTGPSRIYGEQMRAAIAGITDQPIISVLNTHLHPDHFLGNQAFEDIPIGALPGTIEGIRTQGEMFNDSMYRLAGSWMAGTRVVIPGETLKPGTLEVGGHRLRLLALDGHTSADLVILDETTGVLFASDIVFNSRTPTTPHADVGRWLKALDRLASIEFDILVPGHGRVESGAKRFEPVIQTGKYLGWLSGTLSTAAEAGKSMAEVLHPDVPQWVAGQAVFPEEYQRSVVHLFPDYESAALQRGLVEQQ